MSDNIWRIRNIPPESPARQKIIKYAKDNHMEIAAVIIKLAGKL